jgi:hypothetical protein
VALDCQHRRDDTFHDDGPIDRADANNNAIPAVQAKVAPQKTESVSAKSQTKKKNAKVRRAKTRRTRRNGPHTATPLRRISPEEAKVQ